MVATVTRPMGVVTDGQAAMEAIQAMAMVQIPIAVGATNLTKMPGANH